MALASSSSSSPPEVAGVPFLSASDAARELTVLARRFAAAFEWFASRATVGPSELRVRFATASRVLGEHAQTFAALVPESALLALARADGAAAELAPHASSGAVLESLHRAITEISGLATPIADGALVRAVGSALVDVADLRLAVASLEERFGAV